MRKAKLPVSMEPLRSVQEQKSIDQEKEDPSLNDDISNI